MYHAIHQILSKLQRASVTSALLLGSLLLASCAVEPVTGRKQLILSPMDEERNIGEAEWQKVQAANKPCAQQALQSIVEQTGRRLTAETDDTQHPQWSYHLFQGLEANAFCLPTGQVCLYEGLFLHLQNEAELAAVMGHEISHVLARHGTERLSQARMVEAGKMVLATALSQVHAEHEDIWLAAYTGMARYGILYPYSRHHETTADRMALLLMARAGYDPHAAIEFWTRFAQSRPGAQGLGRFLSTHPSSAARIEAMKQSLPEALEFYNVSPKLGLGATFSIAP